MKYNRDYKVEFFLERTNNPYRQIWYRIVPYELPFFKRIFSNKWRQMFNCCEYSEEPFNLFSPEAYKDIVSRLKTYGDVRDYLDEQINILTKEEREMQENIDREWDEAIYGGDKN